MQLPELVTVHPRQTDLMERLADMVGTCFLEEMWYVTWLEALDADEARKLAITQAVIRANYKTTAPYGCVLALPDGAGAANAFLRSDLADVSWAELEMRSELLMAGTLTEREQEVLGERAQAMEPLSDTTWPLSVAGPDDDFIYFISLGVDAARRGSGAFRRLIQSFLSYADEQGITCYLDCYTDRLEGLYAHFGFQTIERKGAAGFDIVERCMARTPRARR